MWLKPKSSEWSVWKSKCLDSVTSRSMVVSLGLYWIVDIPALLFTHPAINQLILSYVANCIKPNLVCILPAPAPALHRSLKYCRLETTEVLLASSHLMTQLGPRSRIAPATNTTVFFLTWICWLKIDTFSNIHCKWNTPDPKFRLACWLLASCLQLAHCLVYHAQMHVSFVYHTTMCDISLYDAWNSNRDLNINGGK